MVGENRTRSRGSDHAAHGNRQGCGPKWAAALRRRKTRLLRAELARQPRDALGLARMGSGRRARACIERSGVGDPPPLGPESAADCDGRGTRQDGARANRTQWRPGRKRALLWGWPLGKAAMVGTGRRRSWGFREECLRW